MSSSSMHSYCCPGQVGVTMQGVAASKQNANGMIYIFYPYKSSFINYNSDLGFPP